MCKPHWVLLVAGIAAVTAPAAWAQVVNGDFEDGDTGWSVFAIPNWTVSFPPSGGLPDGYARVQSPFGDSGGSSLIFQTFDCGIPNEGDVCRISLDFKLEQIDASDETAQVGISFDGVIVWTSELGQSIPWTSISVTRPCGTQSLQLFLAVQAGNHGWAACFDNVSAVCEPGVSNSPRTWSAIKSLFGH